MACDDGQGGNEKGVTQIEVTPEMFSAGWDALLSFDSADYPDRAMVKDVFEAMLLAAPRGWLASFATNYKAEITSAQCVTLVTREMSPPPRFRDFIENSRPPLSFRWRLWFANLNKN